MRSRSKRKYRDPETKGHPPTPAIKLTTTSLPFLASSLSRHSCPLRTCSSRAHLHGCQCFQIDSAGFSFRLSAPAARQTFHRPPRESGSDHPATGIFRRSWVSPASLHWHGRQLVRRQSVQVWRNNICRRFRARSDIPFRRPNGCFSHPCYRHDPYDFDCTDAVRFRIQMLHLRLRCHEDGVPHSACENTLGRGRPDVCALPRSRRNTHPCRSFQGDSPAPQSSRDICG